MNETPPRLASSPTAGSDYAPISSTAVASLIVGVLFVASMIVIAGIAFYRKQSFIEDKLLIFPAIGVLLAFMARRQIANSEGTRVGESYANAGWWLNVLGGLGYIAYLGGVEFAIRNDAQSQFQAWAGFVSEIDPSNPTDHNLYKAAWRMQVPGRRTTVKAGDTAAMEANFGDGIVGLRQMDVVRIAGRNRGNARFETQGVKDWQQTPTRVSCTLACKLVCPEGEFDLVVPMEAAIEEGKREWQVKPTPNGYIQSQALTRYGWMVAHAERMGRDFGQAFLSRLRLPGQQVVTYDAFVNPTGSIPWASFLGEDRTRLAVTGGIGLIYPRAKDYDAGVDGIFAMLGGGKPSEADLKRFRFCWDNSRITFPGASLRDSPDVNPVLHLTPEAVEFRLPVELMVPGGQGPSGTARGRVILRCTDPSLARDLAEAQKNPGPTLAEGPKEILSRPIPWRVVRIESDLKPVPVAPKPGPGGPGGPGM